MADPSLVGDMILAEYVSAGGGNEESNASFSLSPPLSVVGRIASPFIIDDDEDDCIGGGASIPPSPSSFFSITYFTPAQPPVCGCGSAGHVTALYLVIQAVIDQGESTIIIDIPFKYYL